MVASGIALGASWQRLAQRAGDAAQSVSRQEIDRIDLRTRRLDARSSGARSASAQTSCDLRRVGIADIALAARSQDGDITVNFAAIDDCGTPACTLSVSSSEPSNGLGDGDTPVSVEIVNNHQARLRAERAQNGPGRTYTITITCVDRDGNSR